MYVAAQYGTDSLCACCVEMKCNAGCCILQGHLSTTSLLLDCGASLEAADNCQATALVIACANGLVDIARLLLQVCVV